MTYFVDIEKAVHLPDVPPKHQAKVAVMLHSRLTPSGKVSTIKQHQRNVLKREESAGTQMQHLPEREALLERVKREEEKKLYRQAIAPEINLTDKPQAEGAKVVPSQKGYYFKLGANGYEDEKLNTSDPNWQINKDNPLKSEYYMKGYPQTKKVNKFAISYKSHRLILVTPQQSVGDEHHAGAIGIGERATDVGVEGFDDYVRGFYDHTKNAVGFRTPYVKGLKENGMKWNEELTAKAFDIQYEVADRLRKLDPTLTVVLDLKQRDIGPSEQFYLANVDVANSTVLKPENKS